MSYSPTLMRWGEAEPFGAEYVDGPNLYQPLKNNPLKYVDPLGTDAGVTGGDPHTGVAVEVHAGERVVGVLTADFAASGYMGGAKGGGNVITGSDSHVLVTFTPAAIKSAAIVPGTAEQDAALAAAILEYATEGSPPNLADVTKNFTKPWSSDYPLKSFMKPWNQYNVITNNCNHFTLRWLVTYKGGEIGYGDPPGLMGDNLVAGLNQGGAGPGMLGSRPTTQPATTQPATTQPSTGPYIVQRGDTLSQIMQRNGFSYYRMDDKQAFLNANPSITNPDNIHVGQPIVVPSR